MKKKFVKARFLPGQVIHDTWSLSAEWGVSIDEINASLERLGIYVAEARYLSSEGKVLLREELADAIASAERRDREKRLAQLVAEYEHFPHYQDQRFLEDYAAANADKLLREDAEIIEEQRTLHKDQELVALLRERAPDTYERMSWEVKALAIAERLAVTRRLRQKLGENEVRERLVNRTLRQLKDESALRQALIEEGVADEDQIDQYVARFRRGQQERREARDGNGSERLG